MPKIVIIVIGIQYLSGMLLRTTTTFTFGIWDLILHFAFIIQTIFLLFLVYMFINGKTAKEANNEKTKSLLNTIVNLIIFLAIAIIAGNIGDVVLADKFQDLFNIF